MKRPNPQDLARPRETGVFARLSGNELCEKKSKKNRKNPDFG